MKTIQEIIRGPKGDIVEATRQWADEHYPEGTCSRCGKSAPLGATGECEPCMEAVTRRHHAERRIRERLPEKLHLADLGAIPPLGNIPRVTETLRQAVAERRSVYLCGPVGTMKTTMAAACFRGLVHADIDARWTTVEGAFADIKRTWNSGVHEVDEDVIGRLAGIARMGALFLDDLGVGDHAPWKVAAVSELGGDVSPAIRTGGGGADKPHVLTYENHAQDSRVRQVEVSPQINAKAGTGGNNLPLVQVNMVVRRLTPRECERLQGFPDDYTRIPWRGKPAEECPDGPRYRVIGNSIAVPVLTWIARRIEMVASIMEEVHA